MKNGESPWTTKDSIVPRPTRASFAPTRWTLIQRAKGDSPEAKTALRELCEIYYAPVVSFIQHWRRDRDEDTARECAHAFFESILARESLGQPDQTKGRFRNYLLGAVKNFLMEQRTAASTAKRGGSQQPQPLRDDTQGKDVDDTQFDRVWALAIIRHAIDELRDEMDASGKTAVFQTLKPWLDGDASGPQAHAAQKLGMSETAVKVAIYRLRQRFRSKVRTEVLATLHDPREIDEELPHLVAVLTSNQA